MQASDINVDQRGPDNALHTSQGRSELRSFNERCVHLHQQLARCGEFGTGRLPQYFTF